MKQAKRTRLQLGPETIRNLTPEQLHHAAGGNMDGTHGSSYECRTGWCTSNFPTYCVGCGWTTATSALAC